MILVVMGVSGVGKTTVGRLLAAHLGFSFFDADDFHTPASVEKMRRGLALTDTDREPWLESLTAAIRARLQRGESAVLACSALKDSYRERLRVDPAVVFVHLKAAPEVLRRRLEERRGHFFAPDLLASQFDALEDPQGALSLDVANEPPEVLARRIMHELGLTRASH